MDRFEATARDFLEQERFAIAGVSRSPEKTGNLIYKQLKQGGYQVFAVNPRTALVEGDICYPNMAAIPGGADVAIIVTRPEITAQVVRECVEASIPRVWMHNNTFAPSSVSNEAVQVCKDHEIEVLAGGCPLMFMDLGHRCMRVLLGWMGRLPA